MKKRLLMSGVAAAAVLALGAAPAYAGVNGTYTVTNARIRNTPSTNSSQVYGLGQPGHLACVYGQVSGSTVSDLGHTSNLWYQNADLTTHTATGYTWQYYVDVQETRNC